MSLLKFSNSLIFLINKQSYHRWVAPTLKELYRRKEKLPPSPPIKRSTFIEWNRDAEIYAFGKRLNENFNDDLLKVAFTHRSYILQQEVDANKKGIDTPEININDNRELIEAGDKFVNKTVDKLLSGYLKKLPNDGQRMIRDYLTSEAILSSISLHLGTKDIILSGDFPPDTCTLAQTLKAVIGALIQSSGEDRAEKFIIDFIITQLNEVDINDIWKIDKPLDLLTEMLLKENRGVPEARLITVAGKNTILACYLVGIYSDQKLIATGGGENIDVATDIAARECLKVLFNTTDNMVPFKFNQTDHKIQLNQLQ